MSYFLTSNCNHFIIGLCTVIFSFENIAGVLLIVIWAKTDIFITKKAYNRKID